MKKITVKELKKMYISHNEASAPDMDSLWEKIESGLEEKSESGISSKPARFARKLRFDLRWAAAAAAVLVLVPSIIISTNNTKSNINMSDSAAPQAVGDHESNAGGYGGNQLDNNADGMTADEAGGTRTESAAAALAEKIYYSDLDLAPSDGFQPELPYAQTAGDDYFVEDRVLAETDIIVDAVVERVYSSGGGTVCYVLSAEDGDRNPMGELTVESATPYLLQVSREYILPLKATDDGYRLTFENAPQIELTRDGGAVFHNGWQCLSDNSAELIYPQGGIDDFFYDRMRFSYNGMEAITEKWRELKEREE